MQVMVINDDPEVQVRVAKGLMSKGFQVVGMETVARACAYVKIDPVDILITGERVGGRLSHTVALAAECANPMVTTMLLTDRTDPEIEELYDLLPSLYALISPRSDPTVVARLALSAVASPQDAERRMHRNAIARQTQPMADWAAVFQESPARSKAWAAEIGTDAGADPDAGSDADLADFDDVDLPDGAGRFVEAAQPAIDYPAAATSFVAWGAGPSQAADPVNPAQAQQIAPAPRDIPTEPVVGSQKAPTPTAWHVDPDPGAATFEHAFADLLHDERRMEALRRAASQASPDAAVPRNPLFAPTAQPGDDRRIADRVEPVTTETYGDIPGTRPGQVPAQPSAQPGNQPSTQPTSRLAEPLSSLPQLRLRPIAKPVPAQSIQPEVVPPRPSRSDWIAAKVRELETDQSEARSRLHLA